MGTSGTFERAATVDDDTGDRRAVTDLGLALLGGERAWVDEDARPDVATRFAALVEALALSFHVVLLWTVLPDRLRIAGPDRLIVAAVVFGTVAAAALWVRPLQISLGRRARPTALVPRAAWRGACFLLLVVSLVVVLPGWLVVGGWSLGIVAGADLALGAWALGIPVAPRRWWFRFVGSAVHVGVVGAIVAAFVTGRTPDPALRILGLYATMHLGLLIAGLTMVALDGLRRVLAAQRAAERERVVARERQHRVHWLHDDVLSEVHLTALRVERGGASAEQLARELHELDHRIRLRQLDEIFRGGPVRLAEILQPHVRRVQSLGVEVTDVPSLDVVGLRVDERVGRLFGRALSVLTSNAMNAGATSLAVRVRVEIEDERPERVRLEITDDAGGFDLDAVPPGRGLHRLIDDLGPGEVRRLDAPGGSTMVVTIALGAPASGIAAAAAADPVAPTAVAPAATAPSPTTEPTRQERSTTWHAS